MEELDDEEEEGEEDEEGRMRRRRKRRRRLPEEMRNAQQIGLYELCQKIMQNVGGDFCGCSSFCF